MTSSQVANVTMQVSCAAAATGEEEVRDEEQGVSLIAAATPVASPEWRVAAPDAPLGEEVPQHEKRDQEVHLPETDRHEHGVEHQGGEAEGAGQTPCRRTRHLWSHRSKRHHEDPEENAEIAQGPRGLHGWHGGDQSLPRGEEECGERRVGEEERRVGHGERVEMGSEDVAPAEPEVHAEVHLVGVERDEEAVGQAPARATPPLESSR